MTDIKASCLLVINMGSSSIKFQLFSRQPNPKRLAYGKVVDIGGKPLFTVTDALLNSGDAPIDKKSLSGKCTHEEILRFILNWIEAWSKQWPVTAVAHRIVHGGTLFKSSVIIDSRAMQQLWELAPLAPLHQPHNLKVIEIINKLKPEIPQIACFDTAFHAHHKALFTEYALPQTI